MRDHRLPARAVRRHIADYMEINATAASAKYSMVQDKSARGAVQGRLTTAIPLDSTGSDGESVVLCFRGLEQRVLPGYRRQQKRRKQDDQTQSHL